MSSPHFRCGRFALGHDADNLAGNLNRQLFAQHGGNGANRPAASGTSASRSGNSSGSAASGSDANDQAVDSDGGVAPQTRASGKEVEWNSLSKSRYRPRYNISPRSYSPVIRRSDKSPNKYTLDSLQWGLIPHWSKEPPRGPEHTINATCERLFEGGGLWGSVRDKKRCVVVCEGFYEWQKRGKDKLAHFVKPKDGLMLFAGLWDKAEYDGNFDEVSTFTIITVPVSKQLSFLHHRMPAVLTSPEDVELWLSDKPWCPEVQALIKTYDGELVAYQVPPEVGKVQNDSPEFIQPLAKKKGTLANMFAAQTAKKSSSVSPVKNGEGSTSKHDSNSPPPAPNDESSPSKTLGQKERKAAKTSPKPSSSPQGKPQGKGKRKVEDSSDDAVEVIELDADSDSDGGDKKPAVKKTKTTTKSGKTTSKSDKTSSNSSKPKPLKSKDTTDGHGNAKVDSFFAPAD